MNIELHGFQPNHAEDIAVAVWGKLLVKLSKEKFQDSAVTVVCDKSFDHKYRHAPFFRIFSDERLDFVLAAKLLKPIRMPGAGMKTFIECILVHKCLEL